MPFFSIIIPLYNKEAHIEDCLKSVLDQTFSDFELIIIDDGSTDQSFNRATAINDHRIRLLRQSNKGAGYTRNKGVELAIADFIVFIDADDHWQPNHLQCFYDSLQKFPNEIWFSNAYDFKLSQNNIIKGNFKTPSANTISIVDDFFINSTEFPLVNTSSVMLKKSAFISIGGFNDRIISGQDIDLWIRLGLQSPIVFNNHHTSIYDKTVKNSLSKGLHQERKYQLFESYKAEEKINSSFKTYLNSLRYSLAIQCILSKNDPIFKRLKKQIDQSSLNWKQRLLLNQPQVLTRTAKKIHQFLIRQNLYLTAYN